MKKYDVPNIPKVLEVPKVLPAETVAMKRMTTAMDGLGCGSGLRR